MERAKNFELVPLGNEEHGEAEDIPQGPWTGDPLAEGEVALQRAVEQDEAWRRQQKAKLRKGLNKR